MRNVVILFVLFSLLVSACGTFEVYVETTPVGNSALSADALLSTVEPLLSLNSTSEQIQRAMLESATKWKSIWLDGRITHFATDGTDSQATTTREQVWIDLTTDRFRVVSGPADGEAEKFLTSDGVTILELDIKSGQSQSRPLPELGDVKQFVPTLQPGFAFSQPLWGQIGTSLSQLAFPSDFAQNEGKFKSIGTEIIAGREALVAEWTYIQNKLPSWRMWLDTETAVILKMQTFDKSGGTFILSEAVVDQVSFDDVFANSLFGIPLSLPQFSDISGQPDEPLETGADVPSGRDALGELYFFELPRNANQTARLVRMPGLCSVGEEECPKLESVLPPFSFSFSLTALSWSPDGNLAAFAYPDNPNGTPHKLWIFDPAANTWTAIYEYAYIDLPYWSPDGEWLAFRQQDGLGEEAFLVVRPDGSGLKNLTETGDLPDDGKPYVMDGWITGNIIVRSVRPGKQGTVYLIRIADGRVQPMFESLLTKAVFTPAPNGAWIAYDDYDETNLIHSLKVAEPDGANAVELASFTGGTLYPIVWSPDSSKIAFAYYTEITQGTQTSDIYVIDRDGGTMQQVYRGTTVGAVLFSPDGRYILVNETSSSTGGRLFTVNLETFEQRILQSPGLMLDSDWYMPSWRK